MDPCVEIITLILILTFASILDIIAIVSGTGKFDPYGNCSSYMDITIKDFLFIGGLVNILYSTLLLLLYLVYRLCKVSKIFFIFVGTAIIHSLFNACWTISGIVLLANLKSGHECKEDYSPIWKMTIVYIIFRTFVSCTLVDKRLFNRQSK